MRTVLLLMLMTISAPILALASLPGPEADSLVLVLHAPWVLGEDLVAQAGGRVVGPSNAPLGVFAMSHEPSFVARLFEAGAWPVSGKALAALCGVDL